VGTHHPRELLTVLRQGLTIGVQFGTQSVEALLWVAQSIEEGVYEANSLRRTSDGIAFALDNPCLRVGAFGQLRVRVDGVEVPGENIRFRRGPGSAWRLAGSVRPDATWDLAPGDRTEFDLIGSFGRGAGPITVRLELTTEAIPPVVWFEFSETPAPVTATP
jgi:hypothetical protein